VGAWIETLSGQTIPWTFNVAPRVGAWIETTIKSLVILMLLSRPAWARGLKHDTIYTYFKGA